MDGWITDDGRMMDDGWVMDAQVDGGTDRQTGPQGLCARHALDM